MTFTVKQLAKISGISVRTLHWYDQIGLLKPAFKGLNNYRYYEQAQLLRLQQILFFKELGFNLSDIQNLLPQSDSDVIEALYRHRQVLETDMNRKKTLIATIDRTIAHLTGEKVMKIEGLYFGFDTARQKQYEQELANYPGASVQELMKESKKRTSKWTKEKWDEIKAQSDEIYKDLAFLLEKGFEPSSIEVQGIIQRHFQMISQFYDVSKEVYLGLADFYANYPDFKNFFEAYHPKMLTFVLGAIKFYASHNL